LLAAIIVLSIGGLGTTAALSQDKDKAISERQEAMKQQGREMVAVRNYAEGKGEQAAATAAIDALTKSIPKVPDWFPPGTGIGDVTVKTRAKPEIWKEHDKFLAADKTVAGQIASLDAAVKGGDKTKVAALFKEIGFCAGCHDTFRAKEQ
jgi:predicted ribosomally synthesized peptide with SipW-like signal peptide